VPLGPVAVRKALSLLPGGALHWAPGAASPAQAAPADRMSIDSSAEFRLFCLAIRRRRSAADDELLRRGLAGAVDWSCMIAAARRHLLAPMLLAGLQATRCAVPQEVVAELRRDTLAAARRNLAQVAVIGRVGAAFAHAAVPVLVLKGVVLSAQLYGDPGLRSGRDVDLLIDPGALEAADAILRGAGYRREESDLSPRQASAYRRHIKDLQYVDPAGGTRIELHHRVTDNPDLLALDFAALWREREHLRLSDTTIATLSRRHLAPYLCVHGAGHCWERLLWLSDLAELLREPGSVDAALDAAEGLGIGAAMLHAMALAHDWLDLPLDESHVARARASAHVLRLDRILAHLYAGAAWHEMPRRGSRRGIMRYSLWARLYRMGLKSDWRYRASQASREWFTPLDWRTLRLPDALFWLYPFVRPVGWMVRRWQR